MYLIDTVKGNCSVQAIPVDFDATNVDSHHVRMQSASAFFNTANKTLAYQGVVCTH